MRFMLGVFLTMMFADSKADVVRLRVPGMDGQTLALHCVTPDRVTATAVLFIHGASFPTLLAAGFEFHEKDSWMHFMAERGYLACGLDFLGFGASSRPAAMELDPKGSAPLDEAGDAARQIAVASHYLLTKRAIKRLHIIAHSWGTIPAALYATTHPLDLCSLTLFGPIVPQPGSQIESTDFSWWSISPKERYLELQFADVLPQGTHLLEAAVDQKWALQFAASGNDGKSNGIDDPLKIPAGPISDSNAATAGQFPYAPKDVRVPIFVVYGSYDTVVNDAGGADFLSRFTNSLLKWRLRIDDGTHVMHLERNRRSLYQSVLSFIETVEAK